MDGASCPPSSGPGSFRSGLDTGPFDVQVLLRGLAPALVDDLARVHRVFSPGLLVVARPRPKDVTLFELRGTPGRLHTAYPVFVLQALALRYAHTVAPKLWEPPPLGAVWCLVLLPEDAVVVPFRAP